MEPPLIYIDPLYILGPLGKPHYYITGPPYIYRPLYIVGPLGVPLIYHTPPVYKAVDRGSPVYIIIAAKKKRCPLFTYHYPFSIPAYLRGEW